MEQPVFEKSIDEIKRYERKKQKNMLVLNALGCVSLALSLVSMFLILAIILTDTDDKIIQIGMIFSVLVFTLIGMICGTIGFLKARIIRKSGYYATTGLVLNSFGLIINALEMSGLLAVTIIKFF
ncbi:MAG TPA: hypothetical protein GX692_07790 [Acholeplasmataceae bacterium]|jgi:F0F1-type ATP synthase assembly protein I|nr:hypothetical protein [Acholeplasmataceae bacterium]